jgi:hypothetical protein
MSGGFFDYKQYVFDDVIEQLEDVIHANGTGNSWDKDDFDDEAPIDRNLPDDILQDVIRLRVMLEENKIRLHRLDWLLSSDDGEDSYRERLNEELLECSERKMQSMLSQPNKESD